MGSGVLTVALFLFVSECIAQPDVVHTTSNFVFHVYTVPGTNTFSPLADGTVDVLIVAGGGGGGGALSAGRGGGGAGGVILTNQSISSAEAYAIKVGDGGDGGAPGVNGQSGENSYFESFIAVGGGRGSGVWTQTGGHGGSGGGAAGQNTTFSSFVAGQGRAGGPAEVSASGNGRGGGGGGGFGAVGGTGLLLVGGAGGKGYNLDIWLDGVDLGENGWFAGGGGGGMESTGGGVPGSGGLGGGGDGMLAGIGGAGLPGTGGGGGSGGSNNNGGDGGSGVVIIRERNPAAPAPFPANPGFDHAVSEPTLLLSWEPPLFGTATNYVVHLGSASDSMAEIAQTQDVELMIDLIALEAGMTNYWRVDAMTSSGLQEGPLSKFRVINNDNSFYVNDASTNAAHFTAAAGSDKQLGFWPEAPMRTLTNLLAVHRIRPGDIIHVDSGTYNDRLIELNFDGLTNSPIIVKGAPIHGATVFDPLANVNVFRISGSHLVIQDMTIRGGQTAIEATGPEGASSTVNVLIERVVFLNNSRGIVRIMSNAPLLPWIVRQSVFAGHSVRAVDVEFGRVLFDFCTFANNSEHLRAAANTDVSFVTVSNTVFSGGAIFPDRLPRYGDFNIFDAGQVTTLYDNIDSVWRDRGIFEKSIMAAPLLHDPANSNFFPRSVVGRYDPDLDDWVVDGVHSPMIDFGDPLSTAWTNEPAPNGGRVNIGAFGGTPWASMSRTNRWALALTYSDGGVLNAEAGDVIRWVPGDTFTPSDTVRIELSLDSGSNWVVAATGVNALSGQHAWTNLMYDSSRLARWRIVDELNDTVLSQNAADFTFRNGPYVYYINNDSTNGNVFTSAPGNDANPGTSEGSPKATLNGLLSAHPVQPGDIIYIDTGTYVWPNQNITSLFGGDTNDFVYLIGSTNTAAGGTVINRNSTGGGTIGLNLDGAGYWWIQDVTVRNARNGIRMNNSPGNVLLRVEAFNNLEAGVRLQGGSSSALLEHSLIRNNTQAGVRVDAGQVTLLHSVLWQNSNNGLHVAGGSALMTNSVVVASGSSAFAMRAATTSSVIGNYNAFHVTNDALLGYITGTDRRADALASWTSLTGQEQFSIQGDPLFFNPSGGDFHLMTEVPNGRYVPGQGFAGTDMVTSPLIDAGDPASAFDDEPAGGGGRVNIGLHGNTAQASAGRSDPWLHVANPRAGGWLQGTGTLHWVAGNLAAETVSIDFSRDGGHTWTNLATGVNATNELFQWDTSSLADSPAGLWRVISETDTNVMDQATGFVALRNPGPLSIYINNTSTNGNVFTSAPGSPTNWVASPTQPLSSLSLALDVYDLEPGDIVYLDTGVHELDANALVGRRQSGRSTQWVSIVGSTNEAAGGTTLDRGSTASGDRALHVQQADWIAFSNLNVRGAQQGARVDQSRNIRFFNVASYSNTQHGFVASGSSNVVFRHALSAFNEGTGYRGESNSHADWIHSIAWANTAGALFQSGGSLRVTNSVLQATGSGRYVYDATAGTLVLANYNNVLTDDGARVGRIGSGIYDTLVRWQDFTANDVQTLSHEPLFADPDILDFRPLSEAGRYNLVSGAFETNDVVNSPLIDTGSPLSPFGLEPAPNGGRVNIGRYGNTAQASKSRTEPWVLTVSLNAGGLVGGTNSFYWVAGQGASNLLVSVDVSLDGGNEWTNMVAGVAATDEVVTFDTFPLGSSAISKWRIRSDTDGTVLSETDSTFIIYNGPLTFYVNDSSTDGNIYTTEPGNEANDGVTPETPKASIRDVIETYSLREGDQILVDTGEYELYDEIAITSQMPGSITNRIVIQGSTNFVAGGTVLTRIGSGRAFNLDQTEAITLSHLTIRNASTAVRVNQSPDVRLEWIRAEHGGTGFEILAGSPRLEMRHCVAHNNTSSGVASAGPSTTVKHSVLWSNLYGVSTSGGSLSISNSVIGAMGDNRYAYYLTGGAIAADYNNIFLTNGAWAAFQSASPVPVIHRTVSRWARDSGQDRRTLTHDPLFANAASGDFHLRTRAPNGRPLPGGGFTNDTVSSRLIDAGAPSASFDNEPLPNGGRVNIGLYGNTSLASLTATNGLLTMVSLNDGGSVEGTTTIHWVAQGVATNFDVRLEFSADDGASWSNIAASVPASLGEYEWVTTNYEDTALGRLRIVGLQPGVFPHTTERPFALRNAPLSFYVNNAETNDLVYTVAPGSATNTGVSPMAPKASIQDVLDTYDLEPGDTIFVDTGVYPLSSTVFVNQFNAGTAAQRVTIQGSTNELAGGTVLENYGIHMTDAEGIALRNLRIMNAGTAVRYSNSRHGLVEWVRTYGGSTGYEAVSNSDNLVIRNSLARGASAQGVRGQLSTVTIRNVVLDENSTGVALASGTMSVENSIIRAVGPSARAYQWTLGTFLSDYNNILLVDGARMGVKGSGAAQLQYDTVSRWARDEGRDLRTLTHDPLFADREAGNYRLRSEAGRFLPESGSWTNDVTTSPLIDAGNPSADWSEETVPNGGRVNIGLYGNSAQASRSPTTPRFTAVRLSDGGRVEDTAFIHWVAYGDATGDTVRIEFSADAGVSWTNVASGIPAANETYVWNTTLHPSTAVGVWRVVSVTDSNVYDATDSWFAVRNDPLSFYVNDASMTGTVYTAAIGLPTNTGAFPDSPMDSIQQVIDTFRLEAGDTVYIDTGSYTTHTGIAVGLFDQGSPSNRITFQGSTNEAEGGTRLYRQGGGNLITVNNADGIAFRHLNLWPTGAGVVYQSNSDGGLIEWVNIEGGQNGFDVGSSLNLLIRHSSVRNASSAGLLVRGLTGGLIFENGVLWGNQFGVNLSAANAVATVRHSVLGALANNHYAYRQAVGASLSSDYNNLHLVNGGRAALIPTSPIQTIFPNVSRWARDTGRDVHSLSHDPLFVDAASSNFRLLSQGGRSLIGGGWTNDVVTSPLIDAGDPAADFSAETVPNGGRINIGQYGGTPLASRTPTNAWLTVVSVNDGGRIEGERTIYWLAGGDATNELVTLEYSSDNGLSWVEVATNLPASDGEYEWDTTLVDSSILGRWRLWLESNPGIQASNRVIFAVRNTPLSFYVNDSSQSGDVYTTAIGSVDNTGATPDSPRSSLLSIFNSYEIEPGDTIFVDTGNYLSSSPIVIDQFSAGEAENRVVIQGSTNDFGVTQLTRLGNGPVMEWINAHGMELRNVTLRNAVNGVGTGLRLFRANDSKIQWVRLENNRTGLLVDTSPNFTALNSLARNNQLYGMDVVGSSDSRWESGVIWSNQFGVNIRSGNFTIENTVLGAFGSDQYGYRRQGGTLISDYNNFYLPNGGFAAALIVGGSVGGGTNRITSLSEWSANSEQDTFSLSFDPLFANAPAGDFRLLSEGGRYTPGGIIVTDTVSSLLIDAGNPSSDFSAEPDPNGSRINIGMYGNSPQASQTPPGGWLVPLSLNDGGQAQGDIPLRWLAGGVASSHALTLRYSGDAGITWTNIATNAPAASGVFLWDSVPYGSTPLALWELISEDDPDINIRSDNFFSLRNGGLIAFYVNNNSLQGNVYTEAVGSPNNFGISPLAPKASIQDVLASYQLFEGDVIFVDTGTYEFGTPNYPFELTIDDLQKGAAGNPIIIQGSTNLMAGGTILDRLITGADTAGIRFNLAGFVEVRDLTVRNADVGVVFSGSGHVTLRGVRSQQNASAGFRVTDKSSNIQILNSIAWQNASTGLSNQDASSTVINSVFWDNPTAINVPQGSVRVTNSVLQASGEGRRVFNLGTAGTVISDYNNLLRTNNAYVGAKAQTFGGADVYETATDWNIRFGQDRHSLSHVPLFVDPLVGDFRLRSIEGRFNYTNWVQDTVHSPLIDAGDPLSPFDLEPEPNGERINLGAFGNTPFASRGLTNRWLLAVSFNDGGIVSGTNNLYWIGGNFDSNDTVRLEYSSNNGVFYDPIVTNLNAMSGTYVWNVSNKPSTGQGRWRVVYEADAGIRDAVDEMFAIRNETLEFYVNDANMDGTHYTTQPGDEANDGLSPATPLPSLEYVFDRYPVLAGDVIYVDTGVYHHTNTLMITDLNRGEAQFPIQIFGSTNEMFGGSIIDRGLTNGTSAGIQLVNTRYVELHNLTVRNAGSGVAVNNSLHITFNGMRSYSNAIHGFALNTALPITINRSAAWANDGWGVNVGGNTTAHWNQGVIWSNAMGAVSHGGSGLITLSNSILHASGGGAFIYKRGQSGTPRGNFNLLWYEDGAGIARNDFTDLDYENLWSWQNAQNSERNSVLAYPDFVDPATGNFHLQSTMGRYDPAIGQFVTNDVVSSWGIDAGAFSAAFTNEPSPNGGRLNVGLYGNTSRASKSPTNRALRVASFTDGGSIGGTRMLYWLSQGMTSNDTVRLEYSIDEGENWLEITNGVPALAEGYEWDTTQAISSPFTKWRVVDEADTSVLDETVSSFFLRNEPFIFYVNDESMDNVIWAEAPGDSANLGISPLGPKRHLQEVLDAYTLEPGDTIYVDTGYYPISSRIEISSKHSSSAANPIRIIGSPVWQGTIIDRQAQADFTGADGLFFNAANNFVVENLTIQHANRGVVLVGSSGNIFSNLLVRDGGSAAINVGALSPNNRFYRSVLTRHTGVGLQLANIGGTVFDHGIIWSNQSHAISTGQGANLSVSNSVLYASGQGHYIYNLGTNNVLYADYNNLVLTNLALYGLDNTMAPVRGLPQWTLARDADRYSLTVDPLFADPDNDDYHLLSKTRRVLPSGALTNDAPQHSWLIDLGDPNRDVGDEPDPNGGRINIGRYGGTAEASGSKTNAWLYAITASGGGQLQGIFPLAWGWGGMSSTNRVSLDYSSDNGQTWTNIQSNVEVFQGEYLWDSAEEILGEEVYVSSPLARWRVVLEADTNVWSKTESFFSLRNRPFTYYINNDSTNGNVYTTAPGDDANLGFLPSAPKATLVGLFLDIRLDIRGGDTILIDTGHYPITSDLAFTLTSVNSGEPGAPVDIRGSTNFVGGGTVFDGIGSGNAVTLASQYATLRHMTFHSGGLGIEGGNVDISDLHFADNANLSISGTGVTARDIDMQGGALNVSEAENVLVGRLSISGGHVSLQDSQQVGLSNVLVYAGNMNAITANNVGFLKVYNSTLANNGSQYVQSGATDAVLRNNILVADGLDRFAIQWIGGGLDSDYNNLIARNGAWIGLRNGQWEKLVYWQQQTGRDMHSLSAEPLFANPAAGDYHLKSVQGRWTPTGDAVDEEHSPSIDTGDPDFLVGNEPLPNGARINQGAFGGTLQASKSRVGPWVLAASLNDGGLIRDTYTLRWFSGNLSTPVRLEYSPNGGSDWQLIESGLPPSVSYYTWDTTLFPDSIGARWRVVYEGDTNIWDQTDALFTLRNVPRDFFVNVTNSTGGVYTEAPGSPTNDGLTPQTPMDQIQGILDTYELDAGDVIFVDTGTYIITNDIRVIWSRSGTPPFGRATIQGSTDFDAGGTVLVRNNTTTGRVFDVKSSHFNMRDLTLTGAERSIFLDRVNNVELSNLFILSNHFGVVVHDSHTLEMRNLRLWRNTGGGIDMNQARTARVENVTFAGNKPFSFRSQNQLNNTLQNNIFYIDTTNTTALAGQVQNIFIDYNVYDFATDAHIWGSLNNLLSWQLAYAHDYRSAITNAGFAGVESGNFHLLSEAGRYISDGVWTQDATSAWAIDRGNPSMPYDNETAPNGGRINIGAFGNTPFASRGTTNLVLESRQLNEPTFIDSSNSTWPLIWGAINAPTNLLVDVQYSGDGGVTWTNLATSRSVYDEYFVWLSSPDFNSYKGRWRIYGEDGLDVYSVTNAAPIRILWQPFRINQQSTVNGAHRIRWSGASWDEFYQVQYTEDGINWTNAVTGNNTNVTSTANEKPFFQAPKGGAFFFRDVGSTNERFRSYRVIEIRNE